MTPRYKKSVRTEAMQDTRQRLLEAAAGEFARHGYDKANVNHIAEVAGFAIGTVYNYFPTKRELMNAFIDETAQTHVAYIVEQVHSVADPDQRIAEFFKAGFAYVEANPTPMMAVFNALNGPDEEFKVRLFQGYQPLFQLLSEVIELGIGRGNFRQVDPVTTAGLLMLLYLGAGSQFNPQGGLWMDYVQVADFVLHSLRKESYQ